MNNTFIIALIACAYIAFLAGCKPAEKQQSRKAHPQGEHTHADGTTHDDHDDHDHEHAEEEDHAHDEDPLEPVTVDGMKIKLAQGHGKVEAGKEGHLVVKLPYSDKGETVVRAWIGTEDRLKSTVGKGDYDASHDDFNIHAVAPSPLPENVSWWFEIEKPDGAKHVGSAKPILD